LCCKNCVEFVQGSCIKAGDEQAWKLRSVCCCRVL